MRARPAEFAATNTDELLQDRGCSIAYEVMAGAGGHRFGGAVWDEVIDRLMAEAVRLFASARLVGADRVMSGLGVSPEDLVYQAINALLEDKTVRYRKDDGELLPFLKRVMRNDFIDMVRRPVYKRTDIVDPVDEAKRKQEGAVQTLGASGSDPQPDVFWRDRVRLLVADDPKLVEYVDAILELELTKPAEIADLLSTTVEDIYNRRRRLATRIAREPELTRL
jgi:DNA-directed RNA polymerase specialized sigma24 family protein